MTEFNLIQHIVSRLEPQVQDYVEAGKRRVRKYYIKERRDWDVRRMSTDEHRNRNWRDAEVGDRPHDRRNSYRSTYGNGTSEETRIREQESVLQRYRRFNSNNGRYQSRNKGPSENFNREDRRYGG
ncbi:hypothetical protein TNCV_4694201 [Trichonephila clavipes]|uniref:Uncharacterized protein n=1 Tax=Trichonephila clavipes TaxID=2585209 RepID=A0A8X7BH72_TRICX|nr:hypothetical protein TNCV_4694201 [Trichonephila clavipes]